MDMALTTLSSLKESYAADPSTVQIKTGDDQDNPSSSEFLYPDRDHIPEKPHDSELALPSDAKNSANGGGVASEDSLKAKMEHGVDHDIEPEKIQGADGEESEDDGMLQVHN